MKKSKILLTTLISTGVLLAAPASTNAEGPHFKNCSEAWAAGYANIKEGEPGYAPHLDGRKHKDGVACELKYSNGKYKPKTKDGLPLNKVTNRTEDSTSNNKAEDNNSNNDIVDNETDYVVKQGDIVGITLNKYGENLNFSISDENVAKINKVTDNALKFLYSDNAYKIDVEGLDNGTVTLNIFDAKGDKIAEKTIKVVSSIDRPSSNADYTIRVGEKLEVATHNINEIINVYSENTNIVDTDTYPFVSIGSPEGTFRGFKTEIIGKKEGVVYVYILDKFYRVEVLPAVNSNNDNISIDYPTNTNGTIDMPSLDPISPATPNKTSENHKKLVSKATKTNNKKVDTKKTSTKVLPKTSAVK
ncbi:excalibur calcium-binding domain-containing protein [Gemella sp. GH3]|uniref:excalibur calcium-binding domain-containing protein n=1 Tax=unclassified Gemella TaxID=2624949 RepID=UPI0015D061F6|nr:MULTISPECIES: excalibur calcium-binding domain-containing protein [unclassified Gemella]MBF0714539.1 excalibur calcium-binding domain-containing protein [Gemella sp. GH3.1]NYS51491.1 excalibur calcium-binding domain-containing protein [Gemella sp. GH3]